MIELELYRQGDIEEIRKNPLDLAVCKYPYLEVHGIAFSAFRDNELCGCGGIIIRWEGVAEAWLILRNLDFSHVDKVQLSKLIDTKLDNLIAENNLHRLEATVRCDFPKAIEFVEFLGFEREGTMRKYAPDKSDYYMYGKII